MSRLHPVAVAVAAALVLASCSSGAAPRVTGSTGSARPATTAPSGTVAPTERSGRPVPSSPAAVARDAYLAGFPAVVTRRTMQTFAGLAGVNRLLRVSRLSPISSHFVVAPNHDTIYALAILDLRAGPQALVVPRIDRYYTFQFIDAWMDTITNVGTRATGGRAGTWVVVPPHHRGRVPAGDHRIDSPTNHVVVLGRIRAVDDADATVAAAQTAGLALHPVGTPTTAPPLGPAPGPPDATGSNGLGYFDELGDALADDPPPDPAHRAALVAARSLGIGAGEHPSSTATSSEREVLAAAQAGANASLDRGDGLGGTVIDGWYVDVRLGDPGFHPDLRTDATIAKRYWGPNVAAEAVYPVARTASDGKPLDGSEDYRIHLPGDDLPPVGAFWSYTVYGPDSFFVANPIDRYSISGQTPGLERGPGGSIDLYLSHEAPPGHLANWLPTPAGPFRLVMRLYLPEASVLHGTYRYPPVEVVTGS